MFWNDRKVESFVEQNCPKHFRAFVGEKRDIVRSDFSRYCIMWSLGGIYADLDYEPFAQFYADLEPGRVNLVQSPYTSETYQNSLMASPPHHIYWAKLMDLAEYTMSSKNVLLAAGPQLLDTLPMTHNASIVHSLSCNEFQRATHISDARERASSLTKNCKLLRAEHAGDSTLKGIHWGTVSYVHRASKSNTPDEGPEGLMSLFRSFNLEKHGRDVPEAGSTPWQGSLQSLMTDAPRVSSFLNVVGFYESLGPFR